MNTPHYRLRPVEVSAKWRIGARTPEWEQLWRRIITAMMEEDRAIVQNIADAVSAPNPSPNEVDNADYPR